MYKNVFLSLKHDFIRIYTGYRTESWLVIHSKPIFVLPLDTESKKIKEALINCFECSKEITKREEDKEYYLGDKLLKLLKEPSWKSSYMSNMCHLQFRDDDGFSLDFSKYDVKTNSSPLVKEIKLEIDTIDEIDIKYILNLLQSL